MLEKLGMDHETYLAALAKAYRDERVGSVIAGCLATKFGPEWERHNAMLLLQELEVVTGDVLQPLIIHHGLPEPDPQSVEAEGLETSKYTDGWASLVSFFKEALPPIIRTFEEMRDHCPAADRPAIDFLVRHEQALLALAEENGSQAALGTIEKLIQEQN